MQAATVIETPPNNKTDFPKLSIVREVTLPVSGTALDHRYSIGKLGTVMARLCIASPRAPIAAPATCERFVAIFSSVFLQKEGVCLPPTKFPAI